MKSHGPSLSAAVCSATRTRLFCLLCVTVSLSLLAIIFGCVRYYPIVNMVGLRAAYSQTVEQQLGGRGLPCGEDCVNITSLPPQRVGGMEQHWHLGGKHRNVTLNKTAFTLKLNYESSSTATSVSSERTTGHSSNLTHDKDILQVKDLNHTYNLSSTHHDQSHAHQTLSHNRTNTSTDTTYHSPSHTHHDISHGHTMPIIKGYVIAVAVEEQLCSALYDLYQLANVANSWGMVLVEPYVEGSQFKFRSPPPTAATPRTLKYRDLIDINETDLLFKSCLNSRHSVFMRFELFAEGVSSIEHVLVVYLKELDMSVEKCASKYLNKASELKKRIASYVRLEVRSRGREGGGVNFDVVPLTVVCFDTKKEIDFRHLLQKDPRIKSLTESHSNILVLIPSWHGIRTYKEKFFYYDSSYKQPSCHRVHSTPLSNRIQTAAEKYRKFLQLEHPFIGVHIRLERVIHMNIKKPGYASKCVDELIKTLHKLIKQHSTNSSRSSKLQVVAFADYSTLGSMTCQGNRCKKIAEKLKVGERLREIGVTLDHFDPAKLGEPVVTGYAAMTELELLSRADYLVTLGHGSYHRRLTHRFYINHESDWSIKTLSAAEGGDGKTIFAVCS